MISNKEMLLYSAEKAVSAVGKLGAETETDEEAFFIIGTAIHWLVDCEARLEEDNVKMRPEDHKKFSGLKFANNCLKHKKTFEKAHMSDKGHMYPLQFKVKYDGIVYMWGSLDNVDAKGYESQHNRYKEELESKQIYPSLIEIYELIKDYYKYL